MKPCAACEGIHPYHSPVPVQPYLLERARQLRALPRAERGDALDALAADAGVTRRSLYRYLRGQQTMAPPAPHVDDRHLCPGTDQRGCLVWVANDRVLCQFCTRTVELSA